MNGKNKRIRILKTVWERFYPLLSVGLLLAVWAIAARAVGIEMILPPPSKAAGSLFRLLGTGGFWLALSATLYRALISFAVSFVLALLLAVIGFVWKPAARLFSPIVTVTRAVPTMSVILLAVIWLRSEISPMFISALIAFPLLYAAFRGALEAIPADLLAMAEVYAVPVRRRIREVYIPGILPAMFTGLKSGVSLTVKTMIASEVLAQTRVSIGNEMQLSRIYLDTANLLAWTVAAVVLSYLLEGLIVLIRKAVVKWK